MKQRLLALVASLTMVVSLTFTFAAPVLAGSYGACGSSGTNSYHSGEYAQAIRYGIRADIQVGLLANFGPCEPNDNSGVNAASANIGINYGNAFLEFGVINCNHTDNSAWPATLCDGNRHIFLEQHGQFAWDYNMWDWGTVDNAAHTYSISYSSARKVYELFFDYVYWGSVNMGTGLVPQQTNGYYWQAETKDVGDGLGTVSNATNIGQEATKLSDSTRSFHPVNGACDVIDAQHHCVANGSYAFYAYTTN